ncbi:MAG: polyprenyl synthetase family protein [Syntrophobacterales bacterium]|nr:polyprenyl synthetase family protein [Syntrophobacterales bacterium]
MENVYPDLLRIEQELKKQVFGPVPLVNTVSRYIIDSGGKRLRPLLMILSAKLCGYKGDRDARLSVAFEFLHVATLLHDDVIDGAEVRRNRAAANTLWGNQAVVLVGDFLYSKALMLAIEYDDMRIMKALAEAANLMSEGEILQLLNLGRADLEESEYFEVIRRKTAALMSAACRVGAILGGASEEEIENMASYGYHLGIAFQLVDDLLDYIGTAEELGKPIGRDFAERKATLPLIYAFNRSGEEERTWISQLFKDGDKGDPNTFNDVRKWVERTGGLAYTEEIARRHVSNATEALSVFPSGRWKNVLLDIAEYTVSRRF